MFYSLSRRSHHKSAAGLIADGFQISETFPPVSKIHFRRVQTFVVIPVRSFVAQKISVRTGLKQFFVACPASFSDGKGERAVRVLFFSGAEYRNQLFISPVRIFAALQYKGAKAQTVAFFAAAKNFFRSQPVAFCICAAFADTAVIAVVAYTTLLLISGILPIFHASALMISGGASNATLIIWIPFSL